MSHIICVRDTYKKVAELFIIMEIWVFQITHVELTLLSSRWRCTHHSDHCL